MRPATELQNSGTLSIEQHAEPWPHPSPLQTITFDRCFHGWPSCRENLRQLELPAALSSKGNPAFSTPSLRPQLTAPSSTQACTTTRPATAASAEEVQLQLNQDLVAATVKLDNASRRLEVLEREKERLNRSLEEAQVTLDTVSTLTLNTLLFSLLLSIYLC